MATGGQSRILWVDASRGIAIILMIIYHLFFDLDFLSFIKLDLDSGFWFFFPRIIGSMFLLLAGISIVLSDKRDREGRNEGYLHHAKRGLVLAAVAAMITIATWIYPHEGFIQFGIIHMIALSTFIAPLFLRFGKWDALLGLIIIGFGISVVPGLTDAAVTGAHILLPLGITYPGYTALDYYPMLPWFGLVLIGMGAGRIMFDSKAGEPGASPIRRTAISEALAALGKNSLLIYITHQLVLFGVLLIIRMLV